MKHWKALAAALLWILQGMLLSFPGPVALSEPASEEAAVYYQYLRDQVVPGTGLVTGDAVSVPAYKLAETMAARADGLISAAVCDLDGDGECELLTVTAGKATRKNAKYAWQLNLYGRSPETGEIALLDRAENVLYLETDTGSGTMSVHIQRSEGTVYILCDAAVSNFTSSAWDYAIRSIYRVEEKRIADLTAYESQLRGNTGVSLHRADNEATALCTADLRWEEGRITDHTRLADFLAAPESAAAYLPEELNLSDYTEAHAVERSRIDQLVQDLESGVCQLVHLSTSETDQGWTEYLYDTALGCRITVGARNTDGALLFVQISDAKLYDRSFYLKKIQSYLKTDMNDALKSLLSCVLSSSALHLTEEEITGLSGSELIGTVQSDWDRIVFYNRKEEIIGRVTLNIEKSVNTAAAGSNTSILRLTLAGDGDRAAAEAAWDEGAEASEDAGNASFAPAPDSLSGPESPEEAESCPEGDITFAPEAEAAPADPLSQADAHAHLTFVEGRFSKKQTLAVYAAPSTKAWRGANGKASVSTAGTVWLAGSDGKWLLVMYETSGGSVRVGYIQKSKIKGRLPEADPLALEALPAVLTSAAEMTDDPVRGATVIASLAAGARVSFLAVYEDWAYIETTVKKKTARGFVPMAVLNPD